MNLQAWIIRGLLRRRFAGRMAGTIAEQRAWQERDNRLARLPAGAYCEPLSVNDIPAEWHEPADAGPATILYLHGGAYTLGSLNTHRAWVARLAQGAQARALATDYRLAPEHPFPAALEDSLAAYRWLLDQGVEPAHLFLAGDSAGGGLALATLVALRDEGASLPAGAVCLSPWADLALTGASVQRNAATDPILNAGSLRRCAGMYAGENPLTHPLVSPLYADLTGLPPLLIQAATDEILADDAVRVAGRAREAGVDVTLDLREGAFHVYQLAWPLPAARAALAQIAGFVVRNLRARAET